HRDGGIGSSTQSHEQNSAAESPFLPGGNEAPHLSYETECLHTRATAGWSSARPVPDPYRFPSLCSREIGRSTLRVRSGCPSKLFLSGLTMTRLADGQPSRELVSCPRPPDSSIFDVAAARIASSTGGNRPTAPAFILPYEERASRDH